MKVLVTAASRHGSTAEIATIIAGILQASDIEAEVLPPEAVASVVGYDAVILGSAVYARQLAGAGASLRHAARRRPRDATGLPVLERSVGLSIAAARGAG